MTALLDDLRQLIPLEKGLSLALALMVFVLGYCLARLARTGVQKLASRRLSGQHAAIAGRIAFYLILLLALAEGLHQAGFDLSVALGAAGVLTVAIGFAAQTSTSNLISGLFLMAEKPFVVGDTIEVGQTTGEVISIDALSVKLRTVDNLLVRIPNESLLKSEITNLSAFPIRRLDLAVDVAYASDLEHVRHVLEAVADADLHCLDEPRPAVQVAGFGESAIQMRLAVWTETAGAIDHKTRLLMAIHKAFREEAIEIPFPHRTLISAATRPTPPPADGDDSAGTDPAG